MKCHEAHKNIYLFGELSDKDRRGVLEHVKGCKQCAELFESVNEMSGFAKRASKIQAEPEDSLLLTNKIMAGVFADSNRRRSWFEVIMSYTERPAVTWAFVAGSIFLATLFGTQFSMNESNKYSQAVIVPESKNAVIINAASFHEVLYNRKTLKRGTSAINCDDPFSSTVKCVHEKISKLRHSNTKQ
jgi:hypothetical protein